MIPRYRLLWLVLSLAILCAACGPGNTVRLIPPPALSGQSLPAPNAPSICVVNFEDGRSDEYSVGVRRDGSAFTTNQNMSEWIGRALADELARDGLRVTYAVSVAQARSGNPDYLVTGRVDNVWLKEDGRLQLTSSMRVNLALANRKGRIWSETCNSSETKAGLPSKGWADDLLLSTLKDLIKPIAQKIVQTVNKK